VGEQPPSQLPRREKKAAPAARHNPIEANAPWKPKAYTIEVVGAIKALANGTAQPHMQKLALDWIINVAAGTYEEPFRPSQRETDYALGSAHVGRQIVKLINLNTDLLTKRR
jgi:hypothetical protein